MSITAKQCASTLSTWAWLKRVPSPEYLKTMSLLFDGARALVAIWNEVAQCQQRRRDGRHRRGRNASSKVFNKD